MVDPVSALSVMANAAGIHGWFTGLHTGRDQKRLLEEVSKMRLAVERLTDHILYIPSLKEVRDLTVSRREQLEERQTIAELLGPVQSALREEVLATAVISTPERLRAAFSKDPWEVLFSIRPVGKVKKPSDPDIIPVIFSESGLYYIGWQMRGALPGLLDCEYKPAVRIIPPAPSPGQGTNQLGSIPAQVLDVPTPPENAASDPKTGLDEFLGFRFSWSRRTFLILLLTIFQVMLVLISAISSVVLLSFLGERSLGSAAAWLIMTAFMARLAYAVHKYRIKEIGKTYVSDRDPGHDSR